MNEMIARLKREVQKSGRNAARADEVFELLLSTACEQCCSDHGGGNGSCPPPKQIQA